MGYIKTYQYSGVETAGCQFVGHGFVCVRVRVYIYASVTIFINYNWHCSVDF